MMIYIALAGYDYEGDEVIGVYSTKELADDCIGKFRNSQTVNFDYYRIEEHELDE